MKLYRQQLTRCTHSATVQVRSPGSGLCPLWLDGNSAAGEPARGDPPRWGFPTLSISRTKIHVRLSNLPVTFVRP